MRRLLGLAAAVLAGPARADAPPPVVPAAQARDHVGRTVTVELAVRSTGRSRKEGLVFLNTHENFRSNQNFTLVFTPDAQEAFRRAGVADIEAHYFRKVVRATGTVRHFKSVTDMPVDAPGQLVVVGDAPDVAAERAAAEPPGPPAVDPTDRYLLYGSLTALGVGLGVFGASRFARRRPTPPTP
ncbi:MAG: hypothetical protein C0501_16870 [Isosphaera sp.]|nr:hypothetical protein [Isosphaera sp.]